MRCSGGRGVMVLNGSRTAASINATARCQVRRGAAVDGASRERWHRRSTRITPRRLAKLVRRRVADQRARRAQCVDGASGLVGGEGWTAFSGDAWPQDGGEWRGGSAGQGPERGGAERRRPRTGGAACHGHVDGDHHAVHLSSGIGMFLSTP